MINSPSANPKGAAPAWLRLLRGKMQEAKPPFLLKCAVIGAFLIMAAAVFGLFGTYTHADMETLSLMPSLNDANGWDIYTVENNRQERLTLEGFREMELGETYYLSRILDKEWEDEGYTFLRLSSYLPCAVFLDDKLLYTTCPGSVLSTGQVLFPDGYEGLSGRGEAVRCTLPKHYAGKKLTIATTTGHSQYGPSMQGVMLSSEAVESETATATVGSEMIPAAGFAAMALLLMAVWLFAFLQGVYNYQVLLPILAALLQAFSHLRQFEFLSASSTALGSPITQFIPAVSFLLPLVYLLLQIKDKKRRLAFGCILGISSAVAFVSPAASLLGGEPLYSAFLTENKIFYCPLAALLIFTILEVKHGNAELKLFLTGLGLIISSVAILYIGSMFGNGYHADNIATFLSLAHSPAALWSWCAVAFFLLSALISLHKIIQHTAQVHTALSLQTERSNRLDSQLSAQKDFYDALLSHEKEIRSLRHDMDGHLNTIATLLNNERLTEAKDYLSGIAEYYNGQATRIFSSNPYLNAVLQNYAAKCLADHIELECHIGVGEYELPPTELCLILNNAFENALDASMTLPKADRKIKVQATVCQNLFLLRVSNPFRGDVKIDDGLPVTTKSGKEHGYGLSNIRQAAQRRGGSMEYHIQNGYFVLDVEFPVIDES